jgi:integrase
MPPKDAKITADVGAARGGCGCARGAHREVSARVDDGTLLTGLHGLSWRHEYYGTRVFAPAVCRVGLPAGTPSHDLRHHYASVLLAAGESVVAVAERLGHENATLVLSTYAHLLPDSEDRTRRAIDAAWISDGPGTDGGDHPQTSFLVRS